MRDGVVTDESMGILPRVTAALGAVALAMSLLIASPAASAQEGMAMEGMPEGFEARAWALVDAPTALDWASDGRLFVMTVTGTVMAFTPAAGGAAGGGSVFHQLPDTNLALGIAVDPDNPDQVYLSDNSDGEGRVWAVTDTTGDGAGDTRELIVGGLPADGQHFTEELEINPLDDMLYIVSGSRTDNGVDCAGPAHTIATLSGTSDPSCVDEENDWSGALLRVGRDARDLAPGDDGLEVVADGFRNPYDVTFWPSDPSVAYTATNGPTNPSADDVLYAIDVHDGAIEDDPYLNVIDDHGFPSCLINPFERQDPASEHLAEQDDDRDISLEPQQSPNQETIDKYGPCEADEVVAPVATFGRFPAVTGLEFAHGSDFAGTYGNDLYVGQSGSHDLLAPNAGRDIVRVNFRDDGTIVTDDDGLPSVEHFASASTPTDLTFGPDGAMYVADLTGAIIKIAWTGQSDPPDDEGRQGDRCSPTHSHGDDRADQENLEQGESRADDCPHDDRGNGKKSAERGDAINDDHVQVAQLPATRSNGAALGHLLL